MTAKNLGAIPAAGDSDRRRPRAARPRRRRRSATVGDLLARSRQKAAIGEAMAWLSARQQVPVRHGAVEAEEPRTRTGWRRVLHVALQVVDDAKTLLTPFLPSSSSKVHALLGGEGDVGGDARTGRGGRADRGRARPTTRCSPATTTPARAGSRRRSRSAAPIAPPTPVFTKLDPSVVDEELARLAPDE